MVIKISGACTLCHDPFAYPDSGPLLRCLRPRPLPLGTDWARAVRLLTYEQGEESFRVTERLPDSDRATLMEGTLARVYQWTLS